MFSPFNDFLFHLRNARLFTLQRLLCLPLGGFLTVVHPTSWRLVPVFSSHTAQSVLFIAPHNTSGTPWRVGVDSHPDFRPLGGRDALFGGSSRSGDVLLHAFYVLNRTCALVLECPSAFDWCLALSSLMLFRSAEIAVPRRHSNLFQSVPLMGAFCLNRGILSVFYRRPESLETCPAP